jgi:YHS domain-containing protein
MIELDYKLVLNALGLAVFAALMYLTVRRGARDPVCGMTVDRSKALRERYAGATHFFCSEHCRDAFVADPARHTSHSPQPAATDVAPEAR